MEAIFSHQPWQPPATHIAASPCNQRCISLQPMMPPAPSTTIIAWKPANQTFKLTFLITAIKFSNWPKFVKSIGFLEPHFPVIPWSFYNYFLTAIIIVGIPCSLQIFSYPIIGCVHELLRIWISLGLCCGTMGTWKKEVLEDTQK